MAVEENSEKHQIYLSMEPQNEKKVSFLGECLILFYGFPHEYVKLQKAVHMHISISHPFQLQSKLAQQINNQQSLAKKGGSERQFGETRSDVKQ